MEGNRAGEKQNYLGSRWQELAASVRNCRVLTLDRGHQTPLPLMLAFLPAPAGIQLGLS